MKPMIIFFLYKLMLGENWMNINKTYVQVKLDQIGDCYRDKICLTNTEANFR